MSNEKTKQKPVMEEKEDSIPASGNLGMGYSTIRQENMGDYVIASDNNFQTFKKNNAALHISYIKNNFEYQRELHAATNLSVKTPINANINIGLDTAFGKNKSSKNIQLCFKIEETKIHQKLKLFHPKKHIKNKFQNTNIDKFIDMHGDSFISDVYYGKKLTLFITFTCNTEEEYLNLQSKLSMSGLLDKVETSVEIGTKLKKLKEFTEVTISAYAFGTAIKVPEKFNDLGNIDKLHDWFFNTESSKDEPTEIYFEKKSYEQITDSQKFNGLKNNIMSTETLIHDIEQVIHQTNLLIDLCITHKTFSNTTHKEHDHNSPRIEQIKTELKNETNNLRNILNHLKDDPHTEDEDLKNYHEKSLQIQKRINNLKDVLYKESLLERTHIGNLKYSPQKKANKKKAKRNNYFILTNNFPENSTFYLEVKNKNGENIKDITFDLVEKKPGHGRIRNEIFTFVDGSYPDEKPLKDYVDRKIYIRNVLKSDGSRYDEDLIVNVYGKYSVIFPESAEDIRDPLAHLPQTPKNTPITSPAPTKKEEYNPPVSLGHMEHTTKFHHQPIPITTEKESSEIISSTSSNLRNSGRSG